MGSEMCIRDSFNTDIWCMAVEVCDQYLPDQLVKVRVFLNHCLYSRRERTKEPIGEENPKKGSNESAANKRLQAKFDEVSRLMKNEQDRAQIEKARSQ